MMWYFSWILGIGVALSFGIINVLWLESQRKAEVAKVKTKRD
jgi:cytochrome bd-I ubiquinol oxidase subunit X